MRDEARLQRDDRQALVAEPGEAGPPRLPCAWGEVFDRLTVLRRKCSKFTDASRLRHTLAEPGAVNAALWDIDDAIHTFERAGLFDPTFIALARGVIRRNDERAAVKREARLPLGSALIEDNLYGVE